MPPLFPATLAFYAVSAALYLAHLLTEERAGQSVARAARVALLIAFTSHAIDIAWLCMHGLHPGVNAHEALSFASWLICGAFLAASFRFPVPVVGALIVPVTMVLDVAARLTPSAEAPSERALLGSVHITLATAGVALFAVAAGGAVIYLVEERQLKAHRTGLLFKRGTSLEMLDRLSRRCVTIGFPLFTVAMITGAIWVLRRPESHGLWTPQYAMSTVAWLLYAGLIVARVAAGFRGRKAALLTLAGFATTLAVLLLYVFRGVVGA